MSRAAPLRNSRGSVELLLVISQTLALSRSSGAQKEDIFIT